MFQADNFARLLQEDNKDEESEDSDTPARPLVVTTVATARGRSPSPSTFATKLNEDEILAEEEEEEEVEVPKPEKRKRKAPTDRSKGVKARKKRAPPKSRKKCKYIFCLFVLSPNLLQLHTRVILMMAATTLQATRKKERSKQPMVQ